MNSESDTEIDQGPDIRILQVSYPELITVKILIRNQIRVPYRITAKIRISIIISGSATLIMTAFSSLTTENRLTGVELVPAHNAGQPSKCWENNRYIHWTAEVEGRKIYKWMDVLYCYNKIAAP